MQSILRLRVPSLTAFGASIIACESTETHPTPSRASFGTHQYVANKFIEDRVLVQPFNRFQYYLVLDGHGGPQAAEYMTRELPRLFSSLMSNPGSTMSHAMRSSFLEADSNWYSLVRPAYDAGFTGPIKVGACAVCVAVSDTEIVVGSVGDCKCVLAKTSGSYTDLNIQRNANLESEHKRLQALHPGEEDVVRCRRAWTEEVGGSKRFFSSKPVTRYSGCYVKGRLQPTKSFGDFHLKHSSVVVDPERGRPFLDPNSPKSYPYIDADPDITVTRRTPTDDFLIIATDGLWDQFESHEAVELVRAFFKSGMSSDEAARELVKAALENAALNHNTTVQALADIPPGSQRRSLHDDISVCIVKF
jgi:pyruvate dehydrogenase phosphatase